jgi:hypothetical protein
MYLGTYLYCSPIIALSTIKCYKIINDLLEGPGSTMTMMTGLKRSSKVMALRLIHFIHFIVRSGRLKTIAD